MRKIVVVLMTVCFVNVLHAQKIVSGSVLGENNKPIAGVEITIKGTDIKAVTDSTGNYTLEVLDNTSIIVYCKAGFKSQEVELKNYSIIDVKLIYGDIDYLSLEDLIQYQDYYLASDKKRNS